MTNDLIVTFFEGTVTTNEKMDPFLKLRGFSTKHERVAFSVTNLEVFSSLIILNRIL
jgi:hypothetical protein